jgi:hypothetical protein
MRHLLGPEQDALWSRSVPDSTAVEREPVAGCRVLNPERKSNYIIRKMISGKAKTRTEAANGLLCSFKCLPFRPFNVHLDEVDMF